MKEAPNHFPPPEMVETCLMLLAILRYLANTYRFGIHIDWLVVVNRESAIVGLHNDNAYASEGLPFT